MSDIKAISYKQARADFFKAELQKAKNRIKFWQSKIKNAESATQEMEAHDNASNAGWEYNFYKDALEALDAMPKWISVEERLPDKTGKYIVCTTKRSVYCAKFSTNGHGSFHADMNTHIAHWMPLPEPPKEDT